MKTGKQQLKAILLCMVLTICGMIFFPTSAKAAGINYTTLKTDDTWLAGEISVIDEVDYYTVTIPSAGWLTVTYQGLSVGSGSIVILDKDMVYYYDRSSVSGSAENNPKTTYITVALEAGVYHIKTYGNTGTYRVKADFKAAGNNEKESNNDFLTAMPLQMSQLVTGFFSMDDRVDFYKIDVLTKQTVQVICTSYIDECSYADGCYMSIYDKDWMVIESVGIDSGGESNPGTYVFEQELLPGTYYIKVYPCNSSNIFGFAYGRYTIKYEQKVMTNSIKVTGKKQVTEGKKIKLSANVLPTNATDKTVSWTSANSYIASVDSTGRVTAYRPGKVRITVSAQDGSNASKVYTIYVVPKKMKIYSVTNIDGRNAYVRFEGKSGVSGYQVQYATNKKFKHAKTKKISKNKYNATLSKLSKKTYYVRIRGYVKSGTKYYYGSWSSAKRVRIRN